MHGLETTTRGSMQELHVERNIDITPKLREYILSAGYELGCGSALSYVRTIFGESYEEWFCTNASVDEVVEVFTTGDDTLRLDVVKGDKAVLKNCNHRLAICVAPSDQYGTAITVRQRPLKPSFGRF